MVWLIGHRQPKGAATAMLRPTVTAPHLDSTDFDRTIDELGRPISMTLHCRHGSLEVGDQSATSRSNSSDGLRWTARLGH
jgi:hypothetical protein